MNPKISRKVRDEICLKEINNLHCEYHAQSVSNWTRAEMTDCIFLWYVMSVGTSDRSYREKNVLDGIGNATNEQI